jgi:hypothetical protein
VKASEIEALYMLPSEAAEYLGVSIRRLRAIDSAGHLEKLKGAVYSRASVEAYKEKRGDRKGGRYPKEEMR